MTLKSNSKNLIQIMIALLIIYSFYSFGNFGFLNLYNIKLEAQIFILIFSIILMSLFMIKYFNKNIFNNAIVWLVIYSIFSYIVLFSYTSFIQVGQLLASLLYVVILLTLEKKIYKLYHKRYYNFMFFIYHNASNRIYIITT